jgi:hypothetical protein
MKGVGAEDNAWKGKARGLLGAGTVDEARGLVNGRLYEGTGVWFEGSFLGI